MLIAAMLIASYVVGSIPFGLVAGKVLQGIDVREHGSGNIGATNVMRTLGMGPALAVFALDIVKGLVPVINAAIFFRMEPWMPVAAGLCSILGHTFSVFLKFKGGKGVATSLGVIIGLAPGVAGIGFAVWFIILLITRYVSLASMIAALCIPVLMYLFHRPPDQLLFGILAAIFVVAKHHANIKRLIEKKEPKWGDEEKKKKPKVDLDSSNTIDLG